MVVWPEYFRAKQGQNDQVLRLHILREVHIILSHNVHYKRHPPLLISVIGFRIHVLSVQRVFPSKKTEPKCVYK